MALGRSRRHLPFHKRLARVCTLPPSPLWKKSAEKIDPEGVWCAIMRFVRYMQALAPIAASRAVTLPGTWYQPSSIARSVPGTWWLCFWCLVYLVVFRGLYMTSLKKITRASSGRRKGGSAAILCSAALYCAAVLYCTVLYCTVLYCTVLYCTAVLLYCS